MTKDVNLDELIERLDQPSYGLYGVAHRLEYLFGNENELEWVAMVKRDEKILEYQFTDTEEKARSIARNLVEQWITDIADADGEI